MAYVGIEASPLLLVLTPDMFDGEVYQDIASRIIEYRNRFKEPPAPAHLDDIFDHVLGDPDHKQYRAYNRILVGMREQAPSLNVKYLVDRVFEYARSQRLKSGLIEAGERYSQGGEGRDDAVEAILQGTLKQRIETVDYGERMSTQPLSFLDRKQYEDGSQIRTGIDELDRHGLVPTRGELYLLMAPRKRGKSWWLQYLARRASRQYWNSVHISLENRTPLIKERYVQSWVSAAKRDDRYILADFVLDKDEKLDDIEYEVRKPRLVFARPGDRKLIERDLNRWKRSLDRILVKEWPSNVLTVPMLERWLDGLEASEGFVPDMICLDYPQLMKLDPNDLRGSFGRTTIDLRRVAGERNLAMCIVAQTTRAGEDAKLIRTSHMAEDISQAATADTILSYNRTEAEKGLGLARLFVAGGRADRDGFTILLSQSYNVGQFHIDSVAMPGQSYWDMLEQTSREAERENLGAGRKTEAGIADEDDVADAAAE